MTNSFRLSGLAAYFTQHPHELVLALALTYLLYAISHTVLELVAKRDDFTCRCLQRVFHPLAVITIYIVAFIHGLEYVLTLA